MLKWKVFSKMERRVECFFLRKKISSSRVQVQPTRRSLPIINVTITRAPSPGFDPGLRLCLKTIRLIKILGGMRPRNRLWELFVSASRTLNSVNVDVLWIPIKSLGCRSSIDFRDMLQSGNEWEREKLNGLQTPPGLKDYCRVRVCFEDDLPLFFFSALFTFAWNKLSSINTE